MTRGKYIVIEGSDGTGKTTQMSMLRDYLADKGLKVHITSEPADPSNNAEPLPVARELRKLIKNGDIERTPETNLLLFTAARVEKWRNEIEPALARGDYVLSSRNYWSTLAYQGYGEDLSIALIMQQTELYLGGTGYIQPDAAAILSMTDEAERQARLQNRGLRETKDTFETKDQVFQTKVAEGYLQVAHDLDIPIIDAAGTPAAVHALVSRSIEQQLQ
ncbi:MAG: dTMP kinase [Candidatus Saccharimonadales bacterium]